MALENRRFRFWLHDRLHSILPFDVREHACHHVSSDSSFVTLNRVTGKARYRGIFRCGNPWVCPLCAPVIQAARAEQVGSVLRWGHAEGVAFLKIALTCAHGLGDPLLSLLDRQVKAIRSFKSSRGTRAILKSIGYIGSVTSKEATWGPSSGWHPHQHEYWMCNLEGREFDLSGVHAALSREWVRACARQGLHANPVFALHMGRMKADEIMAGAASGYLTKSGTAAAIELAGGTYKQGVKPHKQGHYTPMELLALDEKWADALFLEFYHAFRGRKQLVFSRAILRIYGDLFGTVPGDDFEPLEVENGVLREDEDVIRLDYGDLGALRAARKAVQVLELVEMGMIGVARRLIEEVVMSANEAKYRAAVSYYRKKGAFGDGVFLDG